MMGQVHVMVEVININWVEMALMLHFLHIVRLSVLPYLYYEISKVLGGKKEDDEP